MNGYQRRTEKKREDILNATKKLVCDIPLDRLSIIKIADEANVSQVTIYNLYENKKQLINEAIKSLSIDDINDIISVLSSNTPVSERLLLYFHKSFSHSVNKPQFNGIMAYIFSNQDKELKTTIEKLYVETIPLLTRLYTEGQAAKIIRPSIMIDDFFRLLDIYTRIDRQFLISPNQRHVIIESIIHSFL